MTPRINGFQIVMMCNGTRDVLVVGCAGIETEEQAMDVAVLAARNGYPVGPIDIVSVQTGRWRPCGCPANAEQTATWCN